MLDGTRAAGPLDLQRPREACDRQRFFPYTPDTTRPVSLEGAPRSTCTGSKIREGGRRKERGREEGGKERPREGGTGVQNCETLNKRLGTGVTYPFGGRTKRGRTSSLLPFYYGDLSRAGTTEPKLLSLVVGTVLITTLDLNDSISNPLPNYNTGVLN